MASPSLEVSALGPMSSIFNSWAKMKRRIKFVFWRCPKSTLIVELIWLSKCNMVGISSMFGSYPTMSNASPSGPPWPATYTTEPTSASWPSFAATFNVFFWHSFNHNMARHKFPSLTSKDSWHTMCKSIAMPTKLTTGVEIQRFLSMGTRELVTSIGPNLWRNTPNFISSTTCRTNTNVFASSIATYPLCLRQWRGISPSRPGGLSLTAPPRRGWKTFNFGWPSGIFYIAIGVASWNWCVFMLLLFIFLFCFSVFAYILHRKSILHKKIMTTK